MRRIVLAAMATAAMATALATSFIPHAAAAADDGSICTTETTPADAAIAACNRLIAAGRVKAAQLAAVYFWRAVAYNRKGDYARVIADATESLRLQPDTLAMLNLRGSAYYDKGEYDIAIADFSDAIRIGPTNSTIFHNRGNAYRGKGDYARAIADYDQAIRLAPKEAFSYQNRGASKQALGDLDGALADINEAIRLNPRLPSPLINRGTIWRAKGDFDRAIADEDAAILLANSGVPVPTMTPPGSWLISSYTHRGLAYEAKGDYERAKADFNAALGVTAADAGSKANQATAKARLAVLAVPGRPSSQQTTAAGPPGRRVALVIGNGAYANAAALPNPPKDARAVAQSLRLMGFDVSEGTDRDGAGMQKLVADFLQGATGARIALLFYAGHGMQIDGKNYLVPIDARVDTLGSLVSSMTDVDLILAGLDDQVRTNILILDACRDNPLAANDVAPQSGASRSLAVRSGLAAPAALTAGAMRGAGTLIAFATAPGQVALDGEGVNSPFSAALLRHLDTPGLEVQQMLTRVRTEVFAATGKRQVPWSNSSLLGEVYLAVNR